MKREDLRVYEPCSFDPANDDHKHTRPATDADLAALGYVKLDVDVEAHAAPTECDWWWDGCNCAAVAFGKIATQRGYAYVSAELVDAFRKSVSDWERFGDVSTRQHMNLARQVLAALDKGANDV